MRRYRHSSYQWNKFILLLVLLVFFAIAYPNSVPANMYSQIISILLFFGFIWMTIWIIKKVSKELEETRLTKLGIYDIDKMSGEEFEGRLATLYRNLGYEVVHTGGTCDYGVDLIVEKDGRKIAIQAKRYSNNVGEHAVQEVHTGKHFYHCDEAIIVTNSNFTRAAWRVAHVTGIKLWNRNYLIKVLQTEKERVEQQSMSNQITNILSKFPLKKPNYEEQQPTADSPVVVEDDFKKLFEYINACIAAGMQWETVKANLLQVGWSEDVLNDVFFQVYNPKNTLESLSRRN